MVLGLVSCLVLVAVVLAVAILSHLAQDRGTVVAGLHSRRVAWHLSLAENKEPQDNLSHKQHARAPQQPKQPVQPLLVALEVVLKMQSQISVHSRKICRPLSLDVVLNQAPSAMRNVQPRLGSKIQMVNRPTATKAPIASQLHPIGF